ncbi:MauE/DoxX family redox-associated membrane protein [Desulfonatronovibrio hydrogenovorans]|uniref:MauE/DoxX family redox-associated membrane protein n=1 Tax=Desulfonatronovibrio hydrogenovorans TaxID=53245 RepID=UPI000554B533|nr:MauE/DoxX family redox-associated membrane protein [Desulfonatronovibrio hydrogenovorans]
MSSVSKYLGKFLTSPYLALILRVYIGGLFIYASMYKINYGAEFAETIAGYQLVPYWSVNLLAITMPWLELICGIMLVAGFRAKSATVIISFLLVLFTIAVFINLLRDSPISCGCFSSADAPISWMTVVRDLVWLGMCIHIFFFDKIFHVENRFTAMLKKI